MRFVLKRRRLLQTAVAVSAAGLAYAGLVFLARSADQGARLARLEAQAVRMGAAEASPTTTSGTGVLCRQPIATAAPEIGAKLKADAEGSGLTLGALSFSEPTETLPTDLAGAALEMRVTGDEAALTRFLKTAARKRLPLFLDEVEIVATGLGAVQATLHGRLLCLRDGRR